MRRRRSVAPLLVALVLAGCGGDGTAAAERQLAEADARQSERQYAAVLSRLDSKCLEDRSQIASAAIRVQEHLKAQRATDVPLLDLLRAMEQRLPVGGRGSCAEAALQLTTLGG